MASNIVHISKCSPVKFVRAGYTNPEPYNTKDMDDFVYQNTIRAFEQETDFRQPWQKNDIVFLQFQSNYSPITISLMDCSGNAVDVRTVDQKVSSTDLSGLMTWEIAFALDSAPSGYFYFQVDTGSPVIDTLVSEWIEIRDLHDNTVLLQYKHTENDFGVAFETGIEFRFRIFGGLTDFQPAADRQVFIDQPRSAVMLDAKPYNTRKLIIGDAGGVPPWVIERINYALACDTLLIDGKQYVATPNSSFEARREDGYPMSGWGIEVRPVDNSAVKKFEKAPSGTGPSTTLVYNIETRGFGPITGPASDNTIQIIAD